MFAAIDPFSTVLQSCLRVSFACPYEHYFEQNCCMYHFVLFCSNLFILSSNHYYLSISYYRGCAKRSYNKVVSESVGFQNYDFFIQFLYTFSSKKVGNALGKNLSGHIFKVTSQTSNKIWWNIYLKLFQLSAVFHTPLKLRCLQSPFFDTPHRSQENSNFCSLHSKDIFSNISQFLCVLRLMLYNLLAQLTFQVKGP